MNVSPIRVAGQVQVTLPSPPGSRPPAPGAPPGLDTVHINFSYDKAIKQIVVTLYDAQTGEVIREIPPEKVRHFVATMMEMLAPRFEAMI